MSIEKQLVHLNKVTWIVMTDPDVNTNTFDINITNILNDLYREGYLICVEEKEHSYNIGELRAIDRLILWITQISYAQSEIEDQITMYEDDAETNKYDEMIDEAEDGLIAYRMLQPDAIAIFHHDRLEQNNTKILPLSSIPRTDTT